MQQAKNYMQVHTTNSTLLANNNALPTQCKMKNKTKLWATLNHEQLYYTAPFGIIG